MGLTVHAPSYDLRENSPTAAAYIRGSAAPPLAKCTRDIYLSHQDIYLYHQDIYLFVPHTYLIIYIYFTYDYNHAHFLFLELII